MTACDCLGVLSYLKKVHFIIQSIMAIIQRKRENILCVQLDIMLISYPVLSQEYIKEICTIGNIFGALWSNICASQKNLTDTLKFYLLFQAEMDEDSGSLREK